MWPTISSAKRGKTNALPRPPPAPVTTTTCPLKERAIDGRTDENGSSSPAFEQTRQACDYWHRLHVLKDVINMPKRCQWQRRSARMYIHHGSRVCIHPQCSVNVGRKKEEKEKKTHCNEDIGRNRIAGKLQVIEQEV